MALDKSTLPLEERVYAQLEEEILTGKLKRGMQLRETALAERLYASRTPIRSALHRLAEEGLVKICANKGATVVGIEKEDIEDIYEIRIRLEGLAARLAAERMSQEEKKELTASVELSEFYITKNIEEKCGELDTEFHSMIFKASGSRMLSKILCDLHKNIKAYRKVSLSSMERAKHSVAEHREIARAISEGNCEEAERLTEMHLTAALDNLKEKITKM